MRTFRLDSCLGGRYTRSVNSRDEPALAACQVRQLSVMRAPSDDSVNEQPPYPAVEGRPTWAAKMGPTNVQLSTAVGVAVCAGPYPDCLILSLPGSRLQAAAMGAFRRTGMTLRISTSTEGERMGQPGLRKRKRQPVPGHKNGDTRFPAAGSSRRSWPLSPVPQFRAIVGAPGIAPSHADQSRFPAMHR